MSECVTKTEITPSVKRRVAASVFIVAFAFGLEHYGNPAGTRYFK